MTKGSPLLVAAAALCRDGRVLVQQRPPGASLAGLWEFPGGKLEAGETPQAALARELDEELGIAVEPTLLVPVTFTSVVIEDGRVLILLLFRADTWTGEPRALHASALRWVETEELRGLEMPIADVPLVDVLARR